ncbi:MAG: hypothetical protein IPN61_09760 [Bacteroidetes bacterium]|nr:hypothetical protein [Bacteroidota bacterium]
MKKSFYLMIALMFASVISKAQTTAMDFTKLIVMVSHIIYSLNLIQARL